MSLNSPKNPATVMKNTVIGALTMTTEKMRDAALGAVGGVMNWTGRSIYNVLAGAGKMGLRGLASLPIIPGPR